MNKKNISFFKNSLLGMLSGIILYLFFAIVSEHTYLKQIFSYYNIIVILAFVFAITVTIAYLIIGRPNLLSMFNRIVFAIFSFILITIILGSLELYQKLHFVLGIIDNSSSNNVSGLASLFYLFLIFIVTFLTVLINLIRQYVKVKK